MIPNEYLKEKEEYDSEYEYIEDCTPGVGQYEISL